MSRYLQKIPVLWQCVAVADIFSFLPRITSIYAVNYKSVADVAAKIKTFHVYVLWKYVLYFLLLSASPIADMSDR